MTPPRTGLRALHRIALSAAVGCGSPEAADAGRPFPWTLDEERAHVARRGNPGISAFFESSIGE